MEKRGLISFFDQYNERHQERPLGIFSFREWDLESPGWVQDRIPEWDKQRFAPRYSVPYPEYDIDEMFDRENRHPDQRERSKNPNRPEVSSLDEDRRLSDEEWGILVDDYVDTVGNTGFEALAWYTPFHYTERHWGIYIKEDGIKLLANLLYEVSRGRKTRHIRKRVSGSKTTFDGDPIPTRRNAAKLALEILLRHEWFHHQVEVFSTYLEDLFENSLYTEYKQNAYHATFADSNCIEESLANAYVANSAAVRRFVPPGTFNELFKLSTLSQPEAYREYERFTGNKFKTGCRHLTHLLRNPGVADISTTIGDPDKQIAIGDQLPLERNISQAAERGQIPIHILKPESERANIHFFKAISLDDFYTNYDIHQTESFDKAYHKADGSIRDCVDSQIQKLHESIHHNGFEWRQCKQGLSYLKINDQYRMIARRDDQAQEIELIDFSTDHDLPKNYGCYKNT